MADTNVSEPLDPRVSVSNESPYALLLLAPILAALAGGMGWGIRGQYGHETGAMVPGVLVAMTLVFLFCPHATSLHAARAVAMTAVAFGFGGSMTYGQTVGLTHDTPLVGNHAAYWWGMLGLFIKGGVWIGLAGAFLGMGLGGKRYRPREMLLLLVAMIGLWFVGTSLINQPFEPANKVLPTIYFSDDWHWEPDVTKPRPERWGGLLLALVGLTVYLGGTKKDRLGRNMAWIGFLSGGLGFSIGQSVQASHAWHPEWYSQGPLATIFAHFNWWNMMETTFGLILGFGLGLGLWLNRRHIAVGDVDDDAPTLPPDMEWFLILLHAGILLTWDFRSIDHLDFMADIALTMGVIPLVGIVGGRFWPYMLPLPLLALPIAGKTLRAMSYRTDAPFTPASGWIVFAILPVAVMLAAGLYFWYRGRRGQSGRSFLRPTLILAVWFYFSLNYAFFDFPWPWEPPTGRSPNALIFFICAVGLTIAAVFHGRRNASFRYAK